MVDNLLLKNFKEKLKNAEVVIGPFMKASDPAFVETAGYAGFDFVILDMEHGPCTVETMQNLVRAAVISGSVPIIRTPDSSEESIGKALDIGAFGVQVPQVKNAFQAEEIIKKAKFFPKGERGVCRFVRAADYSAQDKSDYFKSANEAMVILQLEGKEAIENLEEIMHVDGIDIIFIGPYDLSQSLGVPGEINNPKVIEKISYIIEKAKEKGIVVGTFIDNMEAVKTWKEQGILYLSYSVDVGIFFQACKNIVSLVSN